MLAVLMFGLFQESVLMQKFIFPLLLTLFVQVIASPQEANLFIVKPDEKKLNKHSANTLKEMLGESARDTFKRSISLSKQLGQFHVALAAKKEAGTLHQELGTWQIEIASLQQHCSEVLEKLIENQKPFKKATKQELQVAYTSMQEAHDILGTLLTQVKAEQKKIEAKTEKPLGDVVSGAVVLVQGCVKQTKNVQTSFNTHVCLKLT